MTNAREPSARMQQRRARNRQLMLDVAETRFAVHEYTTVKVDEIAADADVSVGTVYTHFGNKDGLLLGVAERALDDLISRLSDAYSHANTALDQVVVTGEICLNYLQENPFLSRFLLMDIAETTDPEISGRIRTRVDGLYEAFAAVIDAAIDAGEAIPIDSYLFARYLVGSWVGVLSMSSRTTGTSLTPATASECVQQASRILLAGFQVAPEPRSADTSS